ncbi:discoidin domain-containing protein [Plantactinospora solaniradicis]|uniref:Discoidin domain-containing protein n=1 Tax=Plantactinospora solaniradicis TaxID=1723736 RepID=A0ABW1K4R7_9ACTN
MSPSPRTIRLLATPLLLLGLFAAAIGPTPGRASAETGSSGTTEATGATGSAPAVAAAGLSNKVHLFYYSWYGNPATYGQWRHWQQGGHTPPDDIGADFYPSLGAYDSGDYAGAVAQHMAWVRQSGAGVIVYSWWGQGSFEDNLAAGVLEAAARQGVKVAWHLEPYQGRTAASTVADVNYINQRYGSSPAFFRDPEHGNRPAFYVFESVRITDWSPIAPLKANNIILAQTTNTSLVGDFGGIYTYDGIAGATAPGWQQAAAYAKANGLVWAPSVAPGYLDDRAVPGNTTPTVDRANGAMYDQQWNNALNPATGGPPSWVSVTSFNEWHEGSSIEPARANPPAGHGYLTYNGAYGRTGAAAETAYLDRTAYWVNRFDPGTGVPEGNLALNRPATASGQCAASEAPGKAVNGTWSGGLSDKWCVLGNTRWLRVDLQSNTQVGRFVLRHSGAGGENPAWNTRDFDLQTSTDGTTWTTVAAVRGNTADVSTHTVAPVTARYVRLNVLAPTSDGNTATRVYELEVYRA